MPWQIERAAHILHVRLTTPMAGAWEPLIDEIERHLDRERPIAVVIPSHLEGGTETDASMLKIVWRALSNDGVIILTPSVT